MRSEHSAAQARFFDDHVDEEHEITRPHGAPRFHRWLLAEKFRRSVAGIELTGARVLVVCAGSGMDAEFLARAGAQVTATDISRGAVRRATERAHRFGLAIETAVADVEHLPYADGEFDIVFVHDGLHHLEDPESGVREMARVARYAVSVTEPAAATVTRAAVRIGLAQAREEAGNRVVRLEPNTVVRVLRTEGFEPLSVERYGMLYRHEPGVPSRALSLPVVFPLARAALGAANAALGRFGNKLVVVAVRP